MASVGVDDVRDVINVSSSEVPDAKVLKMMKRAEVTLELETKAEEATIYAASVIQKILHEKGGFSWLARNRSLDSIPFGLDLEGRVFACKETQF